MYPFERSLVKKMEGKPFALIGVNSDPDRQSLKPVLERERITWRSFWNGPGGTNGTISNRWRVDGWPSIWIIDANGIIRYRDVHDPRQIEAAIDRLLAEMGAK
jgi:hypothetical protein